MKKTALLFFTALLSFTASAQTFLWAEKEGDNSEGQVIATDAAGNSYIAGKIYTMTTIGGQTLNSSAGEFFIVKYDNGGNALWVKQLNLMEIFDIACNGTSVYICGRYHPGASYNGTPIPGGDGWDAFIMRLDTSGNMNLQITGNNPATYECVNSIVADNSGNFYVTGVYRGAAISFGTTTLAGNDGLESMFLLKINSSGSIAWTKTVTSNHGGANGTIVRIAPSGDIYVVSSAQGDSLYYGSIYYNPGAYDAEILLHYDNAGTALRFQLIDQSSYEVVSDMTVDGSGNVYTLKNNYLTSYDVRKFNAALDSTWRITDGTGGHVSPSNLDVMQTGNVMVSGTVGEDATFGGSVTIPNNGGQPGYIARYSGGGSFIVVKQIPGTMYMAHGALDAADNLYITGAVADSAGFDGIALVSGGPEAMFLAKYGVSTTGIAENTANNMIVFPNPCSTILNCRWESPVNSSLVRVFNMLGEAVYEKEISGGGMQIDLRNWSPGVYILDCQENDQVLRKRLVVN